MTRPIKFLSGPVRVGAIAIVAATGLAIPHAQSSCVCFPPLPGMTSDDSVGDEGNAGSPTNLVFSNSSVTGNIEIALTGGFVGTGPGTVTGTVEFAAPNTGQFAPDGVTVTGGATFNNANVQTDLNALNTISQNFRNEGGTPLLISAGASVNASSGILNAHGNEVFTATINPNFTAGTTFTINGTSSQSVVVNITTGGLPFDGSIVLTGGITSDDVLFNFDAGDYTTLSGGDPLLIDTGGLTTTGTYLDPNGQIEIVDSVLDGRIFGGDTADFIISDSTIIAPPSPVSEPTSLALLGIALAAYGMNRMNRRRPRPLGRP
jgi:hypothetical protein